MTALRTYTLKTPKGTREYHCSVYGADKRLIWQFIVRAPTSVQAAKKAMRLAWKWAEDNDNYKGYKVRISPLKGWLQSLRNRAALLAQ